MQHDKHIDSLTDAADQWREGEDISGKQPRELQLSSFPPSCRHCHSLRANLLKKTDPCKVFGTIIARLLCFVPRRRLDLQIGELLPLLDEEKVSGPRRASQASVDCDLRDDIISSYWLLHLVGLSSHLRKK
ncbi:Hypothetical predicted protein [Scomber scombrus]|uniref:Uncharacterized protein n=1 Tax=Scomber scombrus TaxID=13677 RepID=A0AAV1PVN5_SCOSC